MNTLFVDDEPLELEQLEYMIKPLFPYWNLYKANDANQALETAKQIKFHLAFLDIHLPGKSGLELGEELKALHQQMDIIIVSAYSDFHYAKKSIRLGVVDYITKPIIESELIGVLNKYRDKSSLQEYPHMIKDALCIIHNNFFDKLNLVDVASQVHVNPSYLSRKFNEEIGTSFSEYLMNYRIEMAKIYLLMYRHWNIGEVAERTGFSSQHYFSTIFRKVVGYTPKEFREKGK